MWKRCAWSRQTRQWVEGRYTRIQTIRKWFLQSCCGRLAIVQIGCRWGIHSRTLSRRSSSRVWPCANVWRAAVQTLECCIISSLCEQLQANCRLSFPFGSASEEKTKEKRNFTLITCIAQKKRKKKFDKSLSDHSHFYDGISCSNA